MEPLLIGSAIGAATNRKNPLQGALLGGALGGFGSAIMPTLGATTAATTAGTTGALTGTGAATAANTAFMNPAGVNAMTAATTGPTGALGVEAAKQGIFSAPTAVNTAMTPAVERPLSLSMPGVEPGQGYQYTLGDRLGQVGQFAQQNPVLTQMAAQTGQSLLNQQPTLPPPAGLMRGNPTQMQPMQYQVGVPRVSLI